MHPLHLPRASLLGLLALGGLAASAAADELFVASPTTLISQGNPFAGEFNTIGACGGAAQSATIVGDVLFIGAQGGKVYRKGPGDAFVVFAFNVPNDARALSTHAGQLLTGGGTTVVRVDPSTGAVLATFTVPAPVSALVVSGNDVFAGSSLGVVHKGSATTGGFQFFGTCGGPITSMALDSTHLILGSSDGTIYRVNLLTQSLDDTFPAPNDAAAMVLHQGDLLIGGSNASLVRVERFNGAIKSSIGSPASVGALALNAAAVVGSPYCYGIGCPCGNDDPGAGCANSTTFGGRLAGFGSGSVAADDLAIHAFQLPANRVGRFYMAPTIVENPFGAGKLCAGSGGYGIFRFPVESSGPAGSFAMPPDIVAYSSQSFPSNGHILAGSTWHFQAWYRDPSGPCGATFNTSNALSVAFIP